MPSRAAQLTHLCPLPWSASRSPVMPFKLAVPFNRKRTVSTSSLSPSFLSKKPDADHPSARSPPRSPTRPSVPEPRNKERIDDWDDAGFEFEPKDYEPPIPISRVQLGSSTSALSLPLPDPGGGDSLAPSKPYQGRGRGRSMSPLGMEPFAPAAHDGASLRTAKSTFSFRGLFTKDKAKNKDRKKLALDPRPTSNAYSSTSSASSPSSPNRAGQVQTKGTRGPYAAAYTHSRPSSPEALPRFQSAPSLSSSGFDAPPSARISVSQFRQARAARSNVSLHSIDGSGPSSPRLELPMPTLPNGDAPRPPLVRMSVGSQHSIAGSSQQVPLQSPEQAVQDDYFGTPRPPFAQHNRSGSTSSLASNMSGQGGGYSPRPSMERPASRTARQIIHVPARKPEPLTPSSFNAQGWKAANHASDSSSDGDSSDEEEGIQDRTRDAKNRSVFHATARRPSASAAVTLPAAADRAKPSDFVGPQESASRESKKPLDQGSAVEDDLPLSRLSLRPESRSESPSLGDAMASVIYPLGGQRAAATAPSLPLSNSHFSMFIQASQFLPPPPQPPTRGHSPSQSLSPNFSPGPAFQNTRPRVSSNLAPFANGPPTSKPSPPRSLSAFTSASAISGSGGGAGGSEVGSSPPKPRRSYPEPSLASLTLLEQQALNNGATPVPTPNGEKTPSPESSTTGTSGRSQPGTTATTTPASSTLDVDGHTTIGGKPSLMSIMVENEKRKASGSYLSIQGGTDQRPNSGYAYGASIVNGASAARSRTSSFGGSVGHRQPSRSPSSQSLSSKAQPQPVNKSEGTSTTTTAATKEGEEVFSRMKERHKIEAKKAIALGNELHGGGGDDPYAAAGYQPSPWNSPPHASNLSYSYPGGSPQLGGDVFHNNLQSMPPPPGVDPQLYAMLPPDQKHQLQQRGAMLMNMMAQAAAQAQMQAQWSSQMGSVLGGGGSVMGGGGGGGESVMGGAGGDGRPGSVMMGGGGGNPMMLPPLPPMGMPMSIPHWGVPPQPFMMPSHPHPSYFHPGFRDVGGGRSSVMGFPSSASAIGSPSPPFAGGGSPQLRGPSSEVGAAGGSAARRGSRYLTRDV
jgi:hypothetical protein